MSVPRLLHPFAAPAREARDYLEIVRGEGCRLRDSERRRYLDGTASLWYCAASDGRAQISHDLMTFAKGVTSGYLPLGGVVVGPRVRSWLERDDGYLLAHGGTYAGHPSCCAAAVANLTILREERLPERARTAGDRLAAGLAGLQATPGVVQVRGEGLMQAVVLERPQTAGPLTEALLSRGVIGRALPFANAVAFSPPLILTDEEIDELVSAMDEALSEIAAAV